jgi:hypothetical protein
MISKDNKCFGNIDNEGTSLKESLILKGPYLYYKSDNSGSSN